MDSSGPMIREQVPDVLFLDVEMPGKTGFDLVGEIRKLGINPCIIFQTAFDKYAIEAIKNAAFDYLLKPIDKEELLLALAKYKASSHKHQFEDQVARQDRSCILNIGGKPVSFKINREHIAELEERLG